MFCDGKKGKHVLLNTVGKELKKKLQKFLLSKGKNNSSG